MSETRLTALGRKKRYSDTGEWLPYKGSHGNQVISETDYSAIDIFRHNYDLWYMQFTCRSRCALYLGVLDIDFAGPVKEHVKQLTKLRKTTELKELLKDVLDLIRNELSDYPYRIYASGSKGLHVYLKRNDAFVFADNHKDFSASLVSDHLKQLYSPEMIALMDTSFYPHNKGIRPYTCAHPETKVVPYLLEENGWESEYDEDSFLVWICQVLTSCDASMIKRAVSSPPPMPASNHRPPRIPQPNIPLSTEICVDISVSFDTWIRNEAGTAVQKRSSGKYVVFHCPGLGCWCPIAGKYHSKGSSANWFFYKNDIQTCECFHDTCRGKLFVVRKKQEIELPFGFAVPENKYRLVENASNDRYLPRGLLKTELEKNPFVAIQARIGSGKTTQAKQCFEHFGGSGLVIGTRRQQINAWESVFGDLGFVNYEKHKGSLYSVPRALVCLNSLPRLLGPSTGSFQPLPEYDLILLDEVNSLAEWLGGRLLDDAPLVFNILSVLLRSAKRVLAMDGLPTNLVETMFKQLRCFDRFTWLAYPTNAFRKWVFCNDTKYYTECFLKSLRKGLRVFLVSNSKKALFRFYDLALNEGGV